MLWTGIKSNREVIVHNKTAQKIRVIGDGRWMGPCQFVDGPAVVYMIHDLMFCHWGSAIFIIHDCISLGGGHSTDRMDVQRTED